MGVIAEIQIQKDNRINRELIVSLFKNYFQVDDKEHLSFDTEPNRIRYRSIIFDDSGEGKVKTSLESMEERINENKFRTEKSRYTINEGEDKVHSILVY